MNEVGITETPDKIKMKALVDSEGKYTFNRVPEDKIYNISIEKKHFCWEKETQKMKVTQQEAIKPPMFKHLGYEVTYDAGFNFEAELKKES
jgi:hypothetical protein